MSSKEALHLDALNPPLATLAKDDPIQIEDLLTVLEDCETAVRLPCVVKTDALADGRPLAGSEFEEATTDGVAVGVVAGGTLDCGALLLVGGEAAGRGKVEVGLSLTAIAPHESGRETGIRVLTSRAGDRARSGVASVDAGEFTTHVEVETILEEDGVGKGNFLRVTEIDVLRTGGIERDTTGGGICSAKSSSSLGVDDLHGFLAIGCSHVIVRK